MKRYASSLARSYLILISQQTEARSPFPRPNLPKYSSNRSLAFLSQPIVLRGGELTSPPSTRSVQKAEPRTGWLHNTEPPNYNAPTYDAATAARQLLTTEMLKAYRNHRMVHPPAFHPCGEGQRIVVTEHKVSVPISYPDLEAENSSVENIIVSVDRVDSGFESKESFSRPKLDVYFSIIELVTSSSDEEFFQSLVSLTPKQRAEKYLARNSSGIDPSRMFLYLQGGPGFGCAAPVCGLSFESATSSWAAQVLLGGLTNVDGKSFQRVVLMDQRGTGRSSPINKQKLEKLFPDLFLFDDGGVEDDGSPSMQLAQARFSKTLTDATDHLTKFRADSIVRDAEWIKDALISSNAGEMTGPQPWGAALGQSFGGFCLMTYLSSITNPPKICLFTGGIAPMNTPVREVYDRLWLRVRERNFRYYEQYPGDVAVVKKIVRKLMSEEVKLPSGGVLTPRRFLQLGLGLGGSPGVSFASLHSLINSAFVDDTDELARSFAREVEAHQSFDVAPFYFLLHESIYADGPGATEWAAHSSRENINNLTMREFDYTKSVVNENDPTLFFGEMVFPWMAHGDFAEVSGHGMKMLSEELATKKDWLPLFNEANMRRALLGTSDTLPKTKGAAAVYYDDMYVDFDCSMKLVKRGSPLEGLKVWVTNEYQHSGLRDDGATIVKKLLGMAKGCIRVPS